MRNLFLKAEHWQLFIVLVGPIALFQVIMVQSMSSTFASFENGQVPPKPEEFFSMFKFMPLLLVSMVTVQGGWLWSLGTGLHKKVPEHLQMNVKLFKGFLLVYTFYTIFISSALSYIFSNISFSDPTPDLSVLSYLPAIFAIILPLHFFAIFCIIYCMRFVAKTLKTAEIGKKVKSDDYIGEFFLLWFFFIGVWIIQPQVHKILNGEVTNDSDLLV